MAQLKSQIALKELLKDYFTGMKSPIAWCTSAGEELTPSMKLAPNVVGKVFKAEIESLYNPLESKSEDVYIINME